MTRNNDKNLAHIKLPIKSNIHLNDLKVNYVKSHRKILIFRIYVIMILSINQQIKCNTRDQLNVIAIIDYDFLSTYNTTKI